MKVAVFSTQSYDREYLGKYNHEGHHRFTWFEAPLTMETVNLSKGYTAICAFVNDTINREVIAALKENGVQIIALRCAGFNQVDIPAAAEAGIKVVRVPAYSPHAVAEHALALIMTLNRKIHKAYNRVRESNFSLEKLLGFDLVGKTVGVVGTGQIGAVFCEIMLGFGCKVIAYDKFESPRLKEKGVHYLSFEELLSSSDIISLHCPLTPETHHLFDKKAFDKMKEGVMLINTSRGKLINTLDAISALKHKKLGYLGIDVYEQEDKLFFHDLSESIISDEVITRLLTFPNVIVTAHQGFFTREALTQIATTTIQNLSDFENHQELVNEVRIG
ncbi:MAG: 2-hydroxyacid dehydrogenase [Bacteroidia bacterium]|nr:2-hydroxyacid dehydrogenase [Bacteroidia bacterium]